MWVVGDKSRLAWHPKELLKKGQEANLFPLKYEEDDEDDRLFKNHDHDVKSTLPNPGSALQRVSCRDSGFAVTRGPDARI